MATDSTNEHQIIRSWFKNASPWIQAVGDGSIESRKLVTNHAIIEAVLRCNPHSVIDLGCGEGWLTRELCNHDLEVTGIDIVPELIDAAKCMGEGEFKLLSYGEIAEGNFTNPVDALVCNFSLLGKESVENLFRNASKLLNPAGGFIIQTLHPVIACGDHPYEDGWREGSWSGFSRDFSDPAPWYFRTLSSWLRLFAEHQLHLRDLIEPLHPATNQPASIIFIAEAKKAARGAA